MFPIGVRIPDRVLGRLAYLPTYQWSLNLMPIRMKFMLGLVAFLSAMAFTVSASAQTCTGATCPLGGQLRGQIGNGLPLPISLAPGGTGLIRFTHPGQIKATPNATIMQQSPAPAGNPSTAPRSLMLAPGAFTYGVNVPEPTVSQPVVLANQAVFAVLTTLQYSQPHSQYGTRTLRAGGRTGPTTTTNPSTQTMGPVVTWCPGITPPSSNFNPGCLSPSSGPLTNGLMRFTATRNQFGGTAFSRIGGGAQVFFNIGGLVPASLPCNGGLGCQFGISNVVPNTRAVNGAPFPGISATPSGMDLNTINNPSAMLTPGVFTGVVGANGTIVSIGNPVTSGGLPVAFTGQPAQSWGVPQTTGMLTISVTAALNGPEVFVRTGADDRTSGGNGIVTLVTGAVSARPTSGPNGNRGWGVLKIPEPGAMAAASAALVGLFGMHQVVRRRRQ